MSEVYRVYALQSGAGKFYIGFSENVTLRVQQHNAGLTRSTRSRRPWKLVWQSDTLKLSDARRLELDLKRQKGGNGFYQKDWPEKIMKAAPRHGGAAPATNFLAFSRSRARKRVAVFACGQNSYRNSQLV